MTLEQCTKKELIEIINNIQFFDPNAVRRALSDIKYKRSISNIKKAEELDKEANEHFDKYIAFLKKYEGMKLLDIPPQEAKEASEHFEEYQRLTREADKIMNGERRNK